MPGSDFHDHVLFVVGILRNQQQFEFALHDFMARFERMLLVMGHLLHLRIVGVHQQLPRALQPLLDLFPFLVLRHHRGHFCVLLGELLVAPGIGKDLRGRKLLRHFFIARLDVVELFKQRQISHGVRP